MKTISKYWHFVILGLFSLTPIIWFWGRGSVLIDGLDTNFPLNPVLWFGRRFFVWYSLVNAGSDFSSSTSGLFFHLVQTIPFVLTENIQFAQIFSFLFWFFAIVFSSYLFAKSFISKNRLVQIVFVVLYSFNIYLFNTWENIKVSNLALVVGLPLLLSLANNFKDKRIELNSLIFFSSLTAFVCLGAGINPAYFSAMMVGLTIFYLISLIFSEGHSRKRILLGLFSQVLIALAINLIWILPLFNFLFIGSKISNLADFGYVDWVKSLSTNTSIDNVIRLQGAWDWYVKDKGVPIYIPYADKYFYNPLFIGFSFGVPILALISLAFRKLESRFNYVFFCIMAMLGIFLGTGAHNPTGYAFEFLLKYLPTFSFFRSPWYIFTPYLILSLAGLVSILFDRLYESKINKIILSFLIILFMLFHGAYSYPMITGAIFRPGRADSFYVNFPEYIYRSVTWLQENALGRVLTYPDDDLEAFKWGYRGTDSILGLITDIEFISPTFNASNKGVSGIVETYYRVIKEKDIDSIESISRILGVGTILVKNDASSRAMNINTGFLEERYEKTTIGEWDFYLNKDKNYEKKIFSPSVIYRTLLSSGSISLVSPLLEEGFASVSDIDTEVNKTSLDANNLILEPINKFKDEKGLLEEQTYNADIKLPGIYKLALERKGLETVTLLINGKEIKPNNMTATFFIWDSVDFSEGQSSISVIFPENKNLVPDYDYSKYSQSEGLRKEDQPDDISKTLILFNQKKEDIRIYVPVPNFNPFYNYVFSFDYRFFYGWVPGVDLTQKKGDERLRIFPVHPYKISEDWQTSESKVSFENTDNSNLNVIFTLPENSIDSKSKTFIENISLRQVYDNRMFLVRKQVEQKPQNISFKKVSPVEYSVETDNIDGNYYLTFLENYDSNWILTTDNGKNDFPHFSVYGYANGWYIPSGTTSKNLKIYYKPQKLFNFGLSAALLTILGATAYYFIRRKRKVKE